MRKDLLLRHQLERLDRIISARNHRTGFALPGDLLWFRRACAIYHAAICRSLRRHVQALTTAS